MSKMYYKSCWKCVLCVSLTLILLSTIVPPVCSCWCSTSTKLGDITPDQMLLDGSPLLIDCSLNNNTIEYESHVYNVDSSMLLFKFDSQFVSKDRIHLINDTVARIEVKKASATDNGMYYCQLSISGLNHRPLVCLTHITVGYKPQSVTDFKCISLHYRKLHCSWTPPKNLIPTTYRLEDKYHASIDHLSRKCGNIPSDNSCEWTMDTVPPYRNTALKFNLVLTGSNQFGNKSELFVVDHYSIIKPNVPKYFRQTEVTTTKISLRWSPPEYIEFDDELLENIIYEIRYFSQYVDQKGKGQTIILDGIRQTSLNLTDLVPYLKYNISIRCKTVQSKSGEYWSEFSSIVIQTKDDVPYLAPELIPESFHTDKNMEGERSITLFWKQIPLEYQNGPDFYYIIECFEFNRRKSRTINQLTSSGINGPIRSHNTTHTFNSKRSDIAYKFSVYGINSKGMSSNISEIIIEKNVVIPHKPSNIDVYSFGGGRYEVQWTKPRENLMSGPIINYTVFWCQNLRPRPFLCEGAIDWISTKNTSITLELPDLGINYQFAVSANALKSSSGMSWAECIVPIDGRLDKLSDVQLKGLNSTTILVNWKLNCPAQKRVVEGYKIKFCSVESTASESNTVCEKPDSVRTDNSVGSFILNGLEPFTKYRITVLAYSDSGPSEESDPRFITTLHDSPFAPSALEAMNISSHTISLMWRLPIKTNGHISHHRTKINDKIYEQNSDNCNETHCWYTIDNLLSYKYYEIQVQACNSKALCSPDSNALKILTSRDVPNIMDTPRSEIINSTTVRLSWSPPIITNGPIDAYLIKLIRSDNTTKVFNISGNLREYFLTIDCQTMDDFGDNPNAYLQYSVQMSSENFLENGNHLTADFGDTTNLNACILGVSGCDYGYIVGLVAGGSFGLLLLVLVLVALVRRMKKAFDSIRNVKVDLPSRLEEPVLNIDTQLDDGLQFDHYSRSDSYPNIGLGAIGDNNSINTNRHISGLSQTSNDSTERLYNKTTTKTKDNFFRLVSDESGQHESVSSNIQFVNKVNSNRSVTILDENNSDSSGSKDSGVNPKSVRNKKPTKRKPNNLKTNAKIASMVKPTPDRNEVTNPLYDTPISHSVCIYSILANSEPSLFEIPRGRQYSE